MRLTVLGQLAKGVTPGAKETIDSEPSESVSVLKKQQMCWTKTEAHNLLQVRMKVLYNNLKKIFTKWYPGMIEPPVPDEKDRAA